MLQLHETKRKSSNHGTWDIRKETSPLSVLKEAATFAPFEELKRAASATLLIFQAIEAAKENEEAYKRLGDDSGVLIIAIWRSYKKAETSQDWLSSERRKILEVLANTLEEIVSFVQEQLSRNKVIRIMFRKRNASRIRECREYLSYATQKFGFDYELTMGHTTIENDVYSVDRGHDRRSQTALPPINAPHAERAPSTRAKMHSPRLSLNPLLRVLRLVNTILKSAPERKASSSLDGKQEKECGSDERLLVTHGHPSVTSTSKVATIEETRSVLDSVSISCGNCERSQAHSSHQASTTLEITSTSKPVSVIRSEYEYDNTNDTLPGYRQFFDDIEYRHLLSILGPATCSIVRHDSMWKYTKDFSRRIEAMGEDLQAKHLLKFIDERSHIPDFRDRLSTVLGKQSDLRGFLKKS